MVKLRDPLSQMLDDVEDAEADLPLTDMFETEEVRDAREEFRRLVRAGKMTRRKK